MGSFTWKRPRPKVDGGNNYAIRSKGQMGRGENRVVPAKLGGRGLAAKRMLHNKKG